MDLFQPSELGGYECRQCQGSGISKDNQYIQLLDVCYKCGGSGQVDWVTNVVESRSAPREDPLQYSLQKAVISNVTVLKSRIMEEGMKVGMQITVNLEFQNMRDLQLQAHPQFIIPGGLKNV